MRNFINKSEQAQQIDDAENLSQPNDAAKVMIPIPLIIALKVSREHRILRKYVLEFIRKNKLPGFENLGKELPVDFNHAAKYDSKGRLISSLTPEQIAENAAPVVPTYPKQYTLEEMNKLREIAKAEEAKKVIK